MDRNDANGSVNPLYDESRGTGGDHEIEMSASLEEAQDKFPRESSAVNRGTSDSTRTKTSVVAEDDSETGGLTKRRSTRYYAMKSKKDADEDDAKHVLQTFAHKACRDFRDMGKKETALHLVNVILPSYKWIGAYEKKNLQADFIAGLTVGVMIVPQSMAYALVAGLPTIYGLYASVIPIYFYALFGSSRQLAVGPVALVSLLVESALSGTGLDNKEDEGLWIQYAITLAFLTGLFQILMGVCRLGFVVSFLSHSVISGFTSGAAITIGLTQMKYLVGYNIAKSHHINVTLQSMFENIDQLKWRSFLMGSVWLIMLLTFKKLGKTYKKFALLRALGPLIVVVLSTSLMAIFHWNEEDKGAIEVVGSIQRGLPSFKTDFALDKFSKLVSSAIVISFVGFMESIAIAKTLAAKNKYEIDANQELIGLGIANMVGSLFQSYPITGSFSRSAVNNDTGAKTGAAAMVTATAVSITLLCLTSLLYYLPNNALAAIVLSAVSGLFDYQELKFLWHVSKKDCLLWVVSCLGTMFLGIELGIAIAVGISLAFVIYESARPHTAELGRIPGTAVYRSVEQYRDAQTVEGIIILRVDAPIYFANVDFVKDKLRQFENYSVDRSQSIAANLNRGVVGLRFVILEMSPVTSIDSTGVHALREIIQEYKARGIQLALANPKRNVIDQLDKADLPNMMGREFLFLRVHDAVMACIQIMNGEDKEPSFHNAFTTP